MSEIIFGLARNTDLNQLGPMYYVYADSDTIRDIPQYIIENNGICGSILLPPYSIMAELIDDEVPQEMIVDQYMHYLHTQEPMSFIVGLLALLLKGNTIFIDLGYEPEDSFILIPQVLREFFLLRYGIVVRTEYQQYVFPIDPMYLDQIYSDLFLFDYADFDFLKRYHSPVQFNPEVMNKLAMLGISLQVPPPPQNHKFNPLIFNERGGNT